MSRLVLILAAAASLALPASAVADVAIQVPRGFLGGPIATPPPALAPDGLAVAGPGRPSRAPATTGRLCEGRPDDCVVAGPEAELEPVPLPAPGPGGVGVPGDGTGVEDDPPPDDDTAAETARRARPSSGAPRAAPAGPPAGPELAAAFGGLLAPRAADWLAWQRTTLAWRPVAGADYYNVQVFRGSRRVLNAWSRDTRLPLRRGVLRQGRSFVWVVWPGFGPRRAARYGAPVGRSTFAVTLRPRIVFHRPGRERRTAVAEVRPHIPFGTLRLARPARLAGRVPRAVTIDRRGRFLLPISTRAAERLRAVLVDRGPQPPVGLRGPGRL